MNDFDTLKNRLAGAWVFVLLALVTPLFGCAVKKITHADIQQLDHAKNIFESQIENDTHPVIWAYLDEVLHDPYSFRLQRYEYNIVRYTYEQSTQKMKYVFGEPETVQEQTTAPAYQIRMRYRVKTPEGGYMLTETSFYLLKDKTLRLPNGQFVSIAN